MSDIVDNSNYSDTNKLTQGYQISSENISKNIHEYSKSKKQAKNAPPLIQQQQPPRDIYSSRRHSMDYVTVEGVKLRTGYDNKKHWYLLCIKELLDNCIDFLWKNYQGASDAAIEVRIEKTSESLLHIKIRNTNSKNIPVFENLEPIFNYEMRYGSKQNQHIISRGMLGDAMKQIHALPYVLIHANDDGTAFTDEQWPHPLIIRCNKKERHVFLHVDRANEKIEAPIIDVARELSYIDTEIEITWPIINDVDLDIHEIARFCREYPIFTTDISFKFRLVDYSPDKTTPQPQPEEQQQERKQAIAEALEKTLASPARKAPIKIDYPALHLIAPKWSNIGSVHSYKPEEFRNCFLSVYDKERTSVDDVIRTFFREGTNMEKTADNEISIAQLISDSDKGDKKLQTLFYQLRANFTAPEKLSLPYPATTKNNKKRKESLTKRIARLYDNKLNTKKASYISIPGVYKDDIISYPFLFEIIAIQFSNDVVDKEEIKCEFVGSVNYSIAPRANIFEGEYRWEDKKSDEFYRPAAKDITGILEVYNLKFFVHSDAKIKMPCVIFANLVSPRVDYHGHDKSRIDTKPFAENIVAAVKKTADQIQTFKAAGFKFERPKKFRTSSWRSYTPIRENKKETTIRECVRKLLVEKRGLPDVA